MSVERNRKINLLSIIVSDFPGLEKGIRADAFLAKNSQLPSRSQLKRWFHDARIRRNSEVLRASEVLHEGDEILIEIPEESSIEIDARDHPLDIHYEDEHLIVLNKEAGISMHPAANPTSDLTLVHALLHHSNKLSRSFSEEYDRPGIVHRLDKDTSGLVVVAKDDEVHENLSLQFRERKIKRAYWALVKGRTPDQFEVSAPISRHPKHRKMMSVQEHGKEATTHFEKHSDLEVRSDILSLLTCRLMTGRTHQIRVHLKHKGFPILNDPVYGPRSKASLTKELAEALRELPGQALMAYRLGFQHPKTGRDLLFELKAPAWVRPFLSLA